MHPAPCGNSHWINTSFRISTIIFVLAGDAKHIICSIIVGDGQAASKDAIDTTTALFSIRIRYLYGARSVVRVMPNPR
jgi:hypothetical protein